MVMAMGMVMFMAMGMVMFMVMVMVMFMVKMADGDHSIVAISSDGSGRGNQEPYILIYKDKVGHKSFIAPASL